MIQISAAGFSAPIFALALASFIPTQAQATCVGYDVNGTNFEDTSNTDAVTCDDLLAPISADNVFGLGGNDKINIGFGGNPFKVDVAVSGGAGTDTINIGSASVVINVLGADDDDIINISEGSEVSNVNGGTGLDTITIDGVGTIVDVIVNDAGDDKVFIIGGTVDTIALSAGGEIVDIDDDGNIAGPVFQMFAGQDQFLSRGGAVANGVAIDMGDDDDTVILFAGAQDDFTQVSFEGGNENLTDTFISDNGYVGKVGAVTGFELLQVNNSSTLSLTQNVVLVDTKINTGGTLDFDVNNLQLSSTVLNNGTIQAFGGGGGTFQITGNLTNHGLLDMSDDFEGDTLTINGAGLGDYITTTASGVIRLDVFIGGTGSLADNIVINGIVQDAFATGLDIVPTGFDPQLTGTGPGNGIALVTVLGANGTDAADFFLSNGPIQAGLFTYDLVLETDSIWYLQSRLDLGGGIQAFPGVVTAAQQQGELVQGTLHQRMGDLRHEEGKNPNKSAFQIWFRGFGGGNSVDNDTGRFDFNGNTTDLAGGFDSVTYGGQGGADYGFADLFTGQDRLHLGVMGFYGHTDVDFKALAVTSDVDGYGGGVYATYIHPNFYVDTSLLAGKLDFQTRDNARGTTDKYDGDTLGASIETGVPITLGQFVIEPQVQLTYRDVRFDRFQNDDSVEISSDDGESLKGRAGARFAVNLNPAEGLLVSPYLSASVVQEFLGDNTVNADNVRLHSDVAGTSFDGGLGVTASFGNAVSLFAETGGTLGEDVDSYRANLGIRVSW